MTSEDQRIPPLPPELWEKIIGELSHKQFLTARTLSQELKKIVEGTQRFKNITLSADIMNYKEVFKFGARAGMKMNRIEITEMHPIINVEPRQANLNYAEYCAMFGKESLQTLRKDMSAMKRHRDKGIIFWNLRSMVSEKLKQYKEAQLTNLLVRIPRETEKLVIKGKELSYARRRTISAIGQANPVILAKTLNGFKELTLQNANMNASQYLELFQQMGGSQTRLKKFVANGQQIHNFLDVHGINYTHFDIFAIFPVQTLARAFLNVEEVELILKAKADTFFDVFDHELRKKVDLKSEDDTNFALKTLSLHLTIHHEFGPPWNTMQARKYFTVPIKNIQRKIHISILNNRSEQSFHVLSRSQLLNTKNIKSSCCAPRCTAFKIPREVQEWSKEKIREAKSSPGSAIIEDDLFLTGSTIPYMRKRIAQITKGKDPEIKAKSY